MKPSLEERMLEKTQALVSWLPSSLDSAVKGGMKGFLAPFFSASALSGKWKTPDGFGNKLGYYAGVLGGLAGHALIAKGALMGGINWWYLGPLIGSNVVDYRCNGVNIDIANVKIGRADYDDDRFW